MQDFTVKRYGIEIDLSVEGKQQCPKCAKNGNDRSHDNLHVYGLDEDGQHRGAFCWACEYTLPSEEYLEEMAEEASDDEQEFDIMGKPFDSEVREEIKAQTGMNTKQYRGIRTDVSKNFNVRYQYSEKDGSVESTLYPTTKGYKLCGYKVRKHPKDFTSPIGETGKECDLFGEFKFKTHSGIVLITGGEHDQLAAYQVLLDNQKNSKFDPIAVVSPTLGESGAHRQVQRRYKFFENKKKIVVCMDNDEAGRKATEKICQVLPRGKVSIMHMRYKDPNEYILRGKENEFISDFWSARPWTPSGVHGSSSLYDAALNYTSITKLSLPPFMKKAEEMFGGGLVKNELNVIFAKTSQGKSLYVDNMVTHWVNKETDEVVGIMSLEAAKDKYATNIFSRQLGVNLLGMQGEDRLEYLKRDDVKKRIEDFTQKEDGSDRFFVYDNRGSSIEDTKESILEMIIHLGVTLLIFDPFSDLTQGMDLGAQEELLSWLKKLILEYPALSVVLVCHTRKSPQGSVGSLAEDDIMGTSTIMKSSSQTISIERDKLHDNPIMRNVSLITIHKNRHFSDTGPAGEVFYEHSSGRLYDWDEYKDQHPDIAEMAEEGLED